MYFPWPLFKSANQRHYRDYTFRDVPTHVAFQNCSPFSSSMSPWFRVFTPLSFNLCPILSCSALFCHVPLILTCSLDFSHHVQFWKSTFLNSSVYVLSPPQVKELYSWISPQLKTLFPAQLRTLFSAQLRNLLISPQLENLVGKLCCENSAWKL